MKYLLLLSFGLLYLNIFSKGLEWTPQIWLISSELDAQLKENESQYVFEFNNIPKLEGGTKIKYSIDTISHNSILDTDNKLYIKSTPGIHLFQFYYNDKYFEIYSDSLKILPQHTDNYKVRFQSSKFSSPVTKPVIYLYPKTEINFSFKVVPVGEFTFTYPIYKDGWNGIALPNGDIKIDGNMYNYLFWESDQVINMNLIETKKGAIIAGDESLEFLEEKLTEFGFSNKEKADFITYWAPQLQQNNFNYIHFVLNEEADMFAELSVTPNPDSIFRFYILTAKIENPNDFYYLEPQLIEPINRSGFTILEWGGSKIDIINPKMNKKRL